MTVHAVRGRTRYPGTIDGRLGHALPTTYPGLVLATTGLIDYWRLNEASGTTFAEAEGGTSLTGSGTITAGQTGPLADGKSVLFGGGYLTGYDPADYSKRTIECFLKMTTTDGARHTIYTDRGSPGIIFMTGPNIVGGGAAYNLTCEADGSGLAKGAGSTGQALNNGNWHHVVGVANGSPGAGNATDFKLYVDGAEVSTYSNDTYGVLTWPAAPAVFKIGGGAQAAGAMAGWLSEIAIYSVALDAATIAAHYAVSGL